MPGFKKAGIYLFDPTAVESLTGASSDSSSNAAAQKPAEKSSESSCSSGVAPVEFTEDQIAFFQKRYENAYDMYEDQVVET